MQGKFTFVVPLVDKVVSPDWTDTLKRLDETVSSVLNQTDSELQLILVARERPNLGSTDPRIIFSRFSGPSEVQSKPDFFNKSVDKGRKLYQGVNLAKKLGASYVMALDGDDFVSNKLVAFCHENNLPDVWIISRGFIHEDSSIYIYRRDKAFNETCGSCNIFKPNSLPAVRRVDGDFEDYRLLINHQYFSENASKRLGLSVQQVPFHAAVYRVHKTNWFARPRTWSPINMFKRLRYSRVISKQQAAEFSIPIPK